MTVKNELISTAVRASPPVAVSVMDRVGGLHLDDWVLIATLVYTLLQIINTVVRWCTPERK